MMKKVAMICLFVALVSATVLTSAGCSQPGKTCGDVHRGHLRMLRVNQQQLSRDFDRALHLDRPSRLTDMRMP